MHSVIKAFHYQRIRRGVFFSFLCVCVCVCQLLSKTWENFKKTRLRCFEVENVNSIDRFHCIQPFRTGITQTQILSKEIPEWCIVCEFTFFYFASMRIFATTKAGGRSITGICIRQLQHTHTHKNETHVILSSICIRFGVQSFILSSAHCGQIHWAFTGKITDHSKTIAKTKQHTYNEEEEEDGKKEKRMEKGANQKSERTQICYDRSIWRQLKGKNRREAEK